jgi:hypothetical protein
MCAPIGGRSGPVGAHPHKRGRCSNAGGLSAGRRDNYTAVRQLAYFPPAKSPPRILKCPESLAMTPSRAVRELLELIAALDRRVPQMERAGEASIARDAAALKARALKRIEELERGAAPADER